MLSASIAHERFVEGTGISRIVVRARRVLAESVAYDLNMASEHLRHAS